MHVPLWSAREAGNVVKMRDIKKASKKLGKVEFIYSDQKMLPKQVYTALFDKNILIRRQMTSGESRRIHDVKYKVQFWFFYGFCYYQIMNAMKMVYNEHSVVYLLRVENNQC